MWILKFESQYVAVLACVLFIAEPHRMTGSINRRRSQCTVITKPVPLVRECGQCQVKATLHQRLGLVLQFSLLCLITMTFLWSPPSTPGMRTWLSLFLPMEEPCFNESSVPVDVLLSYLLNILISPGLFKPTWHSSHTEIFFSFHSFANSFFTWVMSFSFLEFSKDAF